MTAICKHRTGRKNGGLFSVGQTDFARDVSKTKQPRSITPAIPRTPNQGPETGSEKKNSSTWSLFVAAVTRTSIPLNQRRPWPAEQKGRRNEEKKGRRAREPMPGRFCGLL